MWNLGMVQWVIIPNNHRKRDAERLFLSLRVWVLFCNKNKKTHVQKRDWFQFAIPTSVSVSPFFLFSFWAGGGSLGRVTDKYHTQKAWFHTPLPTSHLPNLCGIGGLNLLSVPLWFLSSSTCDDNFSFIHLFIHSSIHPSFLPSFLPSFRVHCWVLVQSGPTGHIEPVTLWRNGMSSFWAVHVPRWEREPCKAVP
jgi:hypothetical protein